MPNLTTEEVILCNTPSLAGRLAARAASTQNCPNMENCFAGTRKHSLFYIPHTNFAG